MVRNPSDLVGVVVSALGFILVCLMAVYAHNTIGGLSADVNDIAVVQDFTRLLGNILSVPVTVLQVVVILFPPIAVGLDLLLRRHPMVALQGLLAAIGGIILAATTVFLLNLWRGSSLTKGLILQSGSPQTLTMPFYISAITALLTAVATPASRRSIRWSWNLLWIAVVVAVLMSTVSLPAMGLALILGRMAGYAIRYGLGVASRRAYGSSLVEGVQRAGFAPVSIDRVSTVRVKETGQGVPGIQTPQFFSDHRLYIMKTVTNKMYNVIVLDGDRQVMSILSRAWRYLRSRAVDGRTSLSLRQTAERTALLSYAARSAGVSTPAVLAIAEADDSMLIVREATCESVSFADIDVDEVTDELLDTMWDQVRRAHRCGIAHRALTPDSFWVSPASGEDSSGPAQVWLLGWETGDIASSDLARRIDLTQLVALISAKVGPERALASAGRNLNEQDMASVGPLLQVQAVPRATREKMGNAKEILAQLRTDLVHDVPEAITQPEQLTRVRARTILMVGIVMIAIIIVYGTFSFGTISTAVRGADWRWMIAAFGVGLLGFAGAAITFKAFSPVKLSFWRLYGCQVAAAFVNVAVPAGLGTAGVNLRVLTKKKVPTPLAAATAALAQVTTVVVTTLSLVIVGAVAGSALSKSTQDSSTSQGPPTILIVILVVAALVGVVLLIPRSRAWVVSRLIPLLKQTWPRLVELVSSPHRLLLGLLGSVISLLSYITALQFSVYAFHLDINFQSSALVYLVGTSAGSISPTPGGMGTIEVAETTTLAGVSFNLANLASTIIILFRVVTYWIRIPIGFFVYRLMQRLGDL
ncbi:MAG: flippase-like domain-containing protein [Propionibacteriaceae bacterium]|nr:flippase-like domain-containing protein [Propionibacteriaceae bacterium]